MARRDDTSAGDRLARTAHDAGALSSSRLGQSMAWAPVIVVAVVVTVVLVVTSPWYGYYRDELYFRLLADEPRWGYVDQPPLTPFLAKVGMWLFGDTITALRVPAALCTAATVILAALTAAELGGTGRAQLLAAVATATGLFPLLVGHTLLTSSVDLVAWCALWFLAARALLRDPRWWLATGAVFGLALANKHLILILGAGILVGLVTSWLASAVARHRVGLAGAPRCPAPSATGNPGRGRAGRWLVAGAALGILLGLPSLIYQASHGWPQLRMAAALAEQSVVPNRLLVVPGQLVLLGLPLVPVWLTGLVGLIRSTPWRPIRCLGIAHLAVVGIVVATDGRMDYAAATLVPLVAAGCVRLESWSRTPRGARLLGAALAVNAAVSTVVALPLLPADVARRTPLPTLNPVMRGSVGWWQFTSEVALAYRRLTPRERRNAIVLAHDFAQAGALDRFGPSFDLPPVYSGHNELARKRPPEWSSTVLAVGVDPEVLRRVFDRCEVVGYVEEGDVSQLPRSPLTVCRGRRVSWRTAWPAFVHLQ
jgi:hypothetical protein